MTSTDSKDTRAKVARVASARQSRTTARDIPRLLKVPVELCQLRSEARYSLIASSRSEGVLKVRTPPSGEGVFAPGQRLVLMPAGDKARPLRFVVECVTPPTGGKTDDDPGKIYVRWVLISAAGKRSYLADILVDMLGLNVTLASERDRLPPDRVLMFDAETRRIRALQLKGGAHPFAGDAVPEPTEETSSDGVDVVPPPVPEVPSAERPDVLRKAGGSQDRPLEWLMFERPLADGRYDLGGEMFDMRCSWVGFSRCRFEIDNVTGPAMGAVLRVGVPTEPLLRGLVWLDGTVCMNTADTAQGRSVIEVEWSDPPQMMPSGYRSLVAFCRMSTLKRLGDREPQFVS